MPFATVDNIRLFYRLEGAADRPVLVLSHSIGTDMGYGRRKLRNYCPIFKYCDTTPADTARRMCLLANTQSNSSAAT